MGSRLERRQSWWKVSLLSAAMAGSGMLLMAPAVEAAVLQSKSYEYDAEGRMTKEIDADNHATVYTYDGNGNRLTRTDALNHTTTYAYDELNRLTSVTDPATGVTQYSYDARDNLVMVTDPRGLSTTYTYNGFDQLTAQSSPDTGSASFTPNKAGQVTSRTNAASQQTQYVYDALGRVTQATYADGRVVTSTYDQGTNGKGRLTSIADSESTISWTYDADGHVLTRTQTIGSGTGAQTSVITYQYNSAGQLTQMTTPGGAALTYTYDDQGRVQSLSRNGSSIVGSVQYRPFGGITSLTWGNGQIDTRTYDQNGRLDLVTVGTTVNDLGYDAVSRITAIQDMADNTRNKTFSYDTLDRLTGYTGQNSTRSWSYDGVGNRTQQTIGSTTETYVYASASNRLNSLTNSANSTQNRSYQYTTTGHTSTDGVNNYTYDARERLVSATTPTASATYTINPLGQRIRKSVTQSGTTTVTGFIYDDAGHLIAETDGAGVISSEHYWLGDMPVAVDKIVTQSSTGTPVVVDPATSFKFNKWITSPLAGSYGGTLRYATAIQGAPAGIVVDNNGANNVAPNAMTRTGNGAWLLRSNYAEPYGTDYWIKGVQAGSHQGVILDDSQGVMTGSWGTNYSSCTNPASSTYYCNGSGYSYSGSVGAAAISWTTSVATTGTYVLYAWTPVFTSWVGTSYSIQNAAGNYTITPPTTLTGGQWNQIGTYSLSAGAVTFTVNKASNMALMADAFMLSDVTAPMGYFNSMKWTANLPASGSYDVYTHIRTQESFPAATAKYIVDHAAGSTSVNVSQPPTLAQGGWKQIGTYNFNAGLNSVSLSDEGSGTGHIIADAVLFAPVGAPLGNFNPATWVMPTGGASGIYEVKSFLTAPETGYGSSVTWYTVYTSSGPVKVVVNQTLGSGQWVSLGQFSLDPATAKVELADYGVAGKRVYADAVEFIPVSTSTTHTVYYVHPDHLNTSRLITTSDAANTVVWRWDSEPFGSTLPDQDPDQNSQVLSYNLRFPGQYFDSETQLNYNYFRDYNSAIGRYVESDPIGLAGGLDTYNYVDMDPLRFSDIFGLDKTYWYPGDHGRQYPFDGPRNGNWGGKNWSGGSNPNKNSGKSGNAAPTDSGDQCYKDHDDCYQECERAYKKIGDIGACKKRCDKKLVDDLDDLPRNSDEWPMPPRPGTKEDTENFRDNARHWFGGPRKTN